MTAPARTRHPAGRFDRQTAAVCGLTVVVIGGLVLLAEVTDVRALTTWGRDVPATAPAAGLIIVLCGLALSTARLRWVSLLWSALGVGMIISTFICRAGNIVHPVARWLERDPSLGVPLPGYATLVAFAALIGSAVLITMKRAVAAQALILLPLAIGGVAALGFLYGDRSSVLPASAIPGTRSSIPAAAAMLIGALCVLASTPTVGVTAWFWADSPGRRVVRRTLPSLIVVILLTAGLSRWTDLENKAGPARSLAIVVVVICALICVLAALAVRTIDALSADASRAQLLELDLANTKRALRIAELATALSGAGTVDEVVRVVSEGSIHPVNATVASVGMLDARTGLVHMHHGADIDSRTATRYATPHLEEPLALTESIRTGTAVLVNDFDEYLRRYPDTDPSNASLGLGARASLPLRSQDGRAFGSLILAWDVSVELDGAIHSTLSTMADLVAQALERARLIEERLTEAERNVAISEFGQRLADSVSAEEITETTAATAHGLFGAALARLDMVEDLEILTPSADAAAAERTVLVPDLSACDAMYPHRSAAMADAGLAACAAVPVMSTDNRVLGALEVTWATPMTFDERTLGLLTTVAELVGQTLERTRLSEAEHRLSLDLQTRVLRPFPVVDGLSIAGRYRPAEAMVLMGGDWYEGIPIDPHRTAIVVGDVVGHGVAATADMAQLRSVIAALLRVGVPLADLFASVRESIDERSNVMATAFVGIIDSVEGELTYVSAGHPPAMTARGSGASELLADGRGALIGVPATTLEPGRCAFGPGATLVVYTDGLIERRDEPIDAGIQRLRTAVDAHLSLDVETLCDELIAACSVDTGFPDDVALLVARATGSAAPGE